MSDHDDRDLSSWVVEALLIALVLVGGLWFVRATAELLVRLEMAQ